MAVNMVHEAEDNTLVFHLIFGVEVFFLALTGISSSSTMKFDDNPTNLYFYGVILPSHLDKT